MKEEQFLSGCAQEKEKTMKGFETDFNFCTTTQIILEAGGSQRLGELCRPFNARSVVLITDPGLKKLGLVDSAYNSLSEAGLNVTLFSEVEADPSDNTVLLAVELAKSVQADIIIGVGGGSSMDVAKLVALLANPKSTQTLSDIYGVDQVQDQRLPLIQVPTTAGTGSEVTTIAIVTTGNTTKSGIVSQRLLPDLALLDAELTLGLPATVTAATGIDAMVHAIEAYTSHIKKNPLSDLLAKEALKLLATNISTAVHQGQNMTARSSMLLGSTLAGQAFANAPVAAVHALAYPLGGHFHIPHGLSNSLLLPAVLRFNAEAAKHLYAELASILVTEPLAKNSTEQTEQFINTIENLIDNLGLPTQLRDMGISEDALPMLAKDAMQQQRLLINNPRVVSEADALAIYKSIY
ncbi:MAG: alcohol dehydrogenase class IV [Porticoccaceae bacterium]